MAAPRLCRTKSFPGGKPWQVGKGGNLGCASHIELPAEELLPCPLPITTPASRGCSGSSRSPVLDLRSHGKVTPPSHFSPEQQKDQCDGGGRGVKASKQHLGLIPTQAGFPELCLASSQQNQNVVFILFWIQKGIEEKALWMQKKAGTRKASSWEEHSDVGMRDPMPPSSSQSSAHPNCCICCCSCLTHPRIHLGIFQHRGQVEITK